jgi:hypothetical protein
LAQADIPMRSPNVRFLGVKQTFIQLTLMSAFDPKRHARLRITAVRRLARRVFDLTQKLLFVA